MIRNIVKDQFFLQQKSKDATPEELKAAGLASNYAEILRSADRYYDLVFVDLTSRMDESVAQSILDVSDVVVLNITQRLKNINDFLELKQTDDFYKRRNIMLLLGRYDAHSKYNIKNVKL